MVKWMAAGIAAANLVGAIVAVRMTLAHHDEFLATWLFVIGLIAALLSAMVFEHMMRVMETPAVDSERTQLAMSPFAPEAEGFPDLLTVVRLGPDHY